MEMRCACSNLLFKIMIIPFVISLLAMRVSTDNVTVAGVSYQPSDSGPTSNSTMILQRDSGVTVAGSSNDSCVENALERWYETVRNDYYQYTELTACMFSSRLLYQTLFTLSFDSSSLGKYCQLYKTTRDEMDRCPSSPNKPAILNGFALGDYFCLERLSDYMSTMPCLSRQESLGTFSTCEEDGCSEYDSNPYVYTNPTAGATENDTLNRMVMDCRYLQCDIDCRRPIISKQCGKVAASFVLDSLGKVFISISTGLKADSQSGRLWNAFPEECRALMRVSKIDSPSNEINSTKIDINEIQTAKPTSGNMISTTVKSSTLVTTTNGVGGAVNSSLANAVNTSSSATSTTSTKPPTTSTAPKAATSQGCKIDQTIFNLLILYLTVYFFGRNISSI